MCLHDKNYIFSSLLLSQHEEKLAQYPRNYSLHYNINKQGLKTSYLQVKEENQDGMMEEKDPQLSVANI